MLRHLLWNCSRSRLIDKCAKIVLEDMTHYFKKNEIKKKDKISRCEVKCFIAEMSVQKPTDTVHKRTVDLLQVNEVQRHA